MKIKIFFLMVLVAVGLASCYEETDVVADIIKPTGKGFYPVSANTFVDLINAGTISANRTYPGNTNIRFELQYWSDDAIREVNFYKTVGAGARELISQTPYSSAGFSKMKSADTLILNYQLPVVGVQTNIRLDVEIVNENTLSLTRTLTIRSNP